MVLGEGMNRDGGWQGGRARSATDTACRCQRKGARHGAVPLRQHGGRVAAVDHGGRAVGDPRMLVHRVVVREERGAPRLGVGEVGEGVGIAGATGVGPRRVDSARRAPARYCFRHAVRCDEYTPSRRSNASCLSRPRRLVLKEEEPSSGGVDTESEAAHLTVPRERIPVGRRLRRVSCPFCEFDAGELRHSTIRNVLPERPPKILNGKRNAHGTPGALSCGPPTSSPAAPA